MNKKQTVIIYLFFDVLATCLSWFLFYVYRKLYIEPSHTADILHIEYTPRLYLALLTLPLFWIGIYYVTGYYSNICRKSRLIEFGQTFFTTLIGVVILFFSLLLDDYISTHNNYYSLFFTLFCLHFGLTYFFRVIHTTKINRLIHSRKVGFNTLLIGGNANAVQLFHEMQTQIKPSGNKLIGFIQTNQDAQNPLNAFIPCLGTAEDIPQIIEQRQVEEVIVTIDTSEHKLLSQILIRLQRFNVLVWGIPDLYDILSGNQKANNLYSRPLFKISNGIMPVWAVNVKRIMDVVLSILALLIFLPASLLIVVLIKMESRGPIIYTQTRIGRYGKPFNIYKFRSMVTDAETKGPELSSDTDPRITRIGLFLRKTHLDEIPQFINVIIGNMSLVGPRPERQFYIDKLIQKAPQYNLLHKIRPGMTSWGQVKYGYASNVDEMLERLPYDLVYMKNASLYLDIKIMIYSILEVINGNGK
ncbi:sugar transferase [Mangrovibacterium lignilyticum]|uniref:sugar transferase n=1 Tax=Mangrovibacterium lignilyticum TaxID=2668052 RepID=UPI0013D38370|nr:sugar transferase [Mangrovibacterium lignilyticum]